MRSNNGKFLECPILLWLDRLDKPLGVILKILLLIFNIGLSSGVILLLLYCASIDYYPSGVTIGEGFALIAICLAFFLGYTIVTAGIFAAGTTLLPVARLLQKPIIFCLSKIKKKEVPQINFPKLVSFFGIPLAGFLMLLAFVIVSANDPHLRDGLFGSTILMTFYCGLWNTKTKREEDGDKKFGTKFKLGLIVFIVLTPLLIGRPLSGNILKNAMRKIGIRIEGATVQLEKKYAQFVELNGIEPTERNGIKIPGYYTNVTVLFHGIGVNDKIDINGFQLIVPHEEITIGKKS